MQPRAGHALGLLTAIVWVTCICAQATITTAPTNASGMIGKTATFNCLVTGTQGLGQDLFFRRPDAVPAYTISLNGQSNNATKYTVADKYRITVNNLVLSDDGKYQCSLGLASYDFYVTVSVAPQMVSMYWPGNRTWTPAGTPAKLTCQVTRSRPLATFRWFKGTVELTNMALTTYGVVDSQGYGDSQSTLLQTLVQADLGASYRCMVDLPGAAGIVTKELKAAFSGSARALVSMGVVTMVLMTSLLLH